MKVKIDELENEILENIYCRFERELEINREYRLEIRKRKTLEFCRNQVVKAVTDSVDLLEVSKI